jgi:hypothetical protein
MISQLEFASSKRADQKDPYAFFNYFHYNDGRSRDSHCASFHSLVLVDGQRDAALQRNALHARQQLLDGRCAL